MARPRPRAVVPAEHALRGRQATVIRQHRAALIAERDRAEATARAMRARADLAESIADAMSVLTAEQRAELGAA